MNLLKNSLDKKFMHRLRNSRTNFVKQVSKICEANFKSQGYFGRFRLWSAYASTET